VSLSVVAPVAGRAMPLSEVPDPVFSAALVGPGMAIDPSRDGRSIAVSPVEGTVVKLHPHAYVVQSSSGAGVLVHLGIDTVQLAGAGFELLVEENAEVAAGDPVVAWYPAEIERGGRSAICPVVALDATPADLDNLTESGQVATGSQIFVWDR
jgi:PTS system N-acetylglucosamine-specific IIA component